MAHPVKLPCPHTEIKGWAAVKAYTCLSENMLRRALGLYGFPPPRIVRIGSTKNKVWNEEEVLAWMFANEHKHKFVRKAILKKIERLLK